MAPDTEDSAAAETGGEAPTEVEVGVEPEASAAEADPRLAELEARVASLAAQLDLAQEKGRETFGKLKEEHEARLRASADLENYRKRAARERDEVQKFGVERLLKDLLPVADNLDRALAAAPEGDPMVTGVKLVRKVLEEALARHGVEVFSAMGKPFDPRFHEALAQLDAPGAEPGTVVLEHGRGFLLSGRLVRPAMVAVAGPRAVAAEERGAGGPQAPQDGDQRGAGGPQATQDD